MEKTLKYDLSKNIKNLEINTSFIQGLENVLTFFIFNIVEETSQLPEIFKKFEKIITNKELTQLTPVESHMYVIFALHQYLKAEAIKQNLHEEVEIDIPKDVLKDSLKDIIAGNKEDAFKKLNDALSLMDGVL